MMQRVKNILEIAHELPGGRRIFIYCVQISLMLMLACSDNEDLKKQVVDLNELVVTDLDLQWHKLQTSDSQDKTYFVLAVSNYGIPYGSTEPSKGPDFCEATCDVNRLSFFIERKKITKGALIELSNGIAQSGHSFPPEEGSYMKYDFLIDDPPRGVYYYTKGTITITNILNDKLFGTFEVIDPHATYLKPTITGAFNGVPLNEGVMIAGG